MHVNGALQCPNEQPADLLLSHMEKVKDASDQLQHYLRMALLDHETRYERTILGILLYDMGLCSIAAHENICSRHTSRSELKRENQTMSALLSHSLKWFSLEVLAALLYLGRESIRINDEKCLLCQPLNESEVTHMLDFLIRNNNNRKIEVPVENTREISSEVNQILNEYISASEQKGCLFLLKYIIFGVSVNETPSTTIGNLNRNLSDGYPFANFTSVLSTQETINGLYPLLVSSNNIELYPVSNGESGTLDPAKSINTIADSLFAREDVLGGSTSNRDRFQYLRKYIAAILNRILVFREDGVFSLIRTMLFDDRVPDNFTHDAVTHIVNLVVNPLCAGSDEESFRLVCFQLVVALRKHYCTAEEEKYMSDEGEHRTTGTAEDELRRKGRMKGISGAILENWLKREHREAELALSDETLGDRLNITLAALCDSLISLRISKVVKNGKISKGSPFDTLAIINRCLLGPLFAPLSLRRATKIHTEGPVSGGEVMSSLHALWAICHGSSLRTGRGSGSFLVTAWETICDGFLHLVQYLSAIEHNKERNKPMVSLIAVESLTTTTTHCKMRQLAIRRSGSILNLIAKSQSNSLSSHMDKLILSIVTALSNRNTSKQSYYWTDIPENEGKVTFRVAAFPTRSYDASGSDTSKLAIPKTLDPAYFINHVFGLGTGGERKENVTLFIRKMMCFAAEATLIREQQFQALKHTYPMEENHNEDARGVLDVLILSCDPAEMFGLSTNSSTPVTLVSIHTMLVTLSKLSRTTFKYFQIVYTILVVLIKGSVTNYPNLDTRYSSEHTSQTRDPAALDGALAIYLSSVLQQHLQDKDLSQSRLLESVYYQLTDLYNFIMSEAPLCLGHDNWEYDSRDSILHQLRETAGMHLNLLNTTLDLHFSQIKQKEGNCEEEPTDSEKSTDSFPSEAVRMLLVKLEGYVSEAQVALSTKTNKSTIAVSLRCCCDILEEISDQHRSFSENLLAYASREIPNEKPYQVVCPPFAKPLKALVLLALQTFVVELSPITSGAPPTHFTKDPILSTTDLFVRSTAIRILAVQLLQRLDGTVLSSWNPYTGWWLGGMLKEILVQSLVKPPHDTPSVGGLGLCGKSTTIHPLPAFPIPVPRRDLSTLVLLILEVLMAVIDNDDDGVTMKKLDDCILPSTFIGADGILPQKTHHIFPLLQQIIIESSNENSPIFDRRLTVSALYISSYIAFKLYPRISCSSLISLCREVFLAPSMSMMAKAAAAASFRKFVVFFVDLTRKEKERMEREHEMDHFAPFRTNTTGDIAHVTRKFHLPEKRDIILIPKEQPKTTLDKIENIDETCSTLPTILSQALVLARQMSSYRPQPMTQSVSHVNANSLEGDDDDEQSVMVIRNHGVATVHLIEEIRGSAIVAAVL